MSWPNSPNRAWFRLMSLELAAQLDAGYSALAIARCPRRTCPIWELRVELITCGVAEVPA